MIFYRLIQNPAFQEVRKTLPMQGVNSEALD